MAFSAAAVAASTEVPFAVCVATMAAKRRLVAVEKAGSVNVIGISVQVPLRKTSMAYLY